jgi:hypothetical protein
MKIVVFDEIYNFVVQSFSIWSHLHSQIIDKLSRSQFAVFKVDYANNWHRSYVQRARRKELNPHAERWSIETLHKNNTWASLESRSIREVEFARQK